ncbi:LysM peptidoglycan-binding domain-containing protein, partial [Vibrio parahaemolyticus]
MLSKKRSMSFAKRTLLSVSLSLVSGLSFAKMYELPEDGSRLIGRIENHVVQEGETMANIAKHYDVGMLALMAANKGVDPFLP